MSAYKIQGLNNVSKFILFSNKHTNNCEFEQRHHTSVVMWLGGHLERIAGIKKIKHFNVIRVKINNIHLNPPLFSQPMSLYCEDISHWGKYKIYGDENDVLNGKVYLKIPKCVLSLPKHIMQSLDIFNAILPHHSLYSRLSLSYEWVKRREGRTMFHGRLDRNCKWKKRFLG